jgi:3',5'-cyclic AMP phosphodiesterase CpdA
VGKRFLGWLSWTLRRRHTHRPEVLEALFDDLHRQHPDHVAVTGDLTNVALDNEFVRASAWLHELGEPDFVSIVPGNHDAYVRVEPARSWDLWAPYLVSDDAIEPGAGDAARAPVRDEFPTLRRRGDVALVGLCSAVPSLPFLATGRLGRGQLERLDGLLARLGDEGACRVVLIHHPPTDRHTSARRRLTDFAALGEVIRRRGAELVLHGHVHRRIVDSMPGPDGPVPVVSVSSASDVGEKPRKRACYHLYELSPTAGSAGPRWRIRARCRGFDPGSGGFVDEGAEWLGAPPEA